MLVTLCCVTVRYVHAADIPWQSDKTSTYQFEQKRIPELLKEFAASQGLAAVISPSVEGIVSGRFKFNPQAFLQWVCTTSGLIWYYDGNLLYIYSSDESYTQIVRLQYSTPAKIKQSLSALNITDTRFNLKFDPDSSALIISGPRRYVELVQESIAFLEDNERARAVDIKVFPLKYAWAQDQVLSSGGREIVIPGVASTLRNLLSNRTSVTATSPSATNSVGSAAGTSSIGSTRQSNGASNNGRGSTSNTSGNSSSSATNSTSSNVISVAGTDLPQIQADTRLNAVLVRDLPDRMQRYTDLIKSLDVKSNMVEIEVVIMDVSSEHSESIGVDWRFRGGRLDAQIGTNPNSLPSLRIGDFAAGGANLLTLGANVAQPAGALMSTVIGGAGRHVLTRINALANDGKARVLSSPRVLTLDNLEANIENSSTFYVQVTGTDKAEGQLFNVTVGTSLRVTPLIINEGGEKKIRLAIKVEDGSILDQKIKEIPIVQKHAINTQALIALGQSLLIAGHTYETSKNALVAVPVLSEIPIIGHLFKHTEKTNTKMERMYLITPRIVGE